MPDNLYTIREIAEAAGLPIGAIHKRLQRRNATRSAQGMDPLGKTQIGSGDQNPTRRLMFTYAEAQEVLESRKPNYPVEHVQAILKRRKGE